MSGLGWEWALCFLGIAYVIVSLAVMAFSRWHKKRFRRLPAPQPQVFRDAYREHSHAVGHLRGIK